MKSCFLDSISLFEFLTENFNKVVVEEGVIRFVYGTRVRGERTITIELVKEETDPIKLVYLRIEKLKEEIQFYK
jgi:hypothetical protein